MIMFILFFTLTSMIHIFSTYPMQEPFVCFSWLAHYHTIIHNIINDAFLGFVSLQKLIYSLIFPFTECVPLFSTRSMLRAASVAAQASISSASSSRAVCSSSYFCISADIRRHLAEPQSQGRGWSDRKRNKENQNKYIPNKLAWKCVQAIFVILYRHVFCKIYIFQCLFQW